MLQNRLHCQAQPVTGQSTTDRGRTTKQQPLTFRHLGFQTSDDDNMDYDMALEGIDVNDLDPYTDDEDLLDDVEDERRAGGSM
jgi:hypothetical protein